MKSHRNACVEKLEPRTLLSAWSTVDSLDSAGSVVGRGGMAADRAGHVYAVGYAPDGTAFIREKLGTSPGAPGSWTTVVSTPSARFYAVAVDANGDVFVGGGVPTVGGDGLVWELPKGAGPDGFKVVDDLAGAGSNNGGAIYGLAIDAAGNIYAAGTVNLAPLGGNDLVWTVRKGTYDPSTGSWAFTTVDQAGSANAAAFGVTAINGGVAAGVYAVGRIGASWTIRKSTDGGNTWAQIDGSFEQDPSGTVSHWPYAVAGDTHGDVYVVGFVPMGTSSSDDWIVRKSVDGGASWSTDDQYRPTPSAGSATPFAIGTDPAGNVYVAGSAFDGAGRNHAVIRSNAGGNWMTVDDYSSSTTGQTEYLAFTADSAGNLYAGGIGRGQWLIRSAPSPAPTEVTLDFNYLVTLARNYSHPGTFATGDLNGDGQVSFDDLVLLARNYGKTVSPSDLTGIASPAAGNPTTAATFFSSMPHHRRRRVIASGNL